MIKGRAVMFLDGDFRKDHPKPTVYSSRNDDGKWSVTKAGPGYINVYAISQYDAEGEVWLHAHAADIGDTVKAVAANDSETPSVPQSLSPVSEELEK